MWAKLAFVFFVVLAFSDDAQAIDCTGQEDGIYEYSCFFYVTCEGGVAHEIRCNSSKVFDPDYEQCVEVGGNNWPCASVEDCSYLDDGRHPDYGNGCLTYYTCKNGIFYGHNWCPEDLVYDPESTVCNWPENVLPPCGTYTPETIG